MEMTETEQQVWNHKIPSKQIRSLIKLERSQLSQNISIDRDRCFTWRN